MSFYLSSHPSLVGRDQNSSLDTYSSDSWPPVLNIRVSALASHESGTTTVSSVPVGVHSAASWFQLGTGCGH